VATALKRAWPRTRITWILQPAARALVGDHPAIDDFIVFDRRAGLGALTGFVDFAQQVRGRRFDLLLGLQVYLKAGVLTALTSSTVKLGFDRARARDLQWLFTTHRIPAHEPQHVQDQYFEFVRWLGLDPEPVTWGLAVADAERDAQASFFARLDHPACAVVVGTSNPRKNWHADGYACVLEALERDHGLQPVLVGGPSANERRIADEILARTSARVVDALGDDVRKLVWILEASALALSPDTGPLHIARAMGTPVVGLFGHTNPRRSGPYRAYQDLVVDGYGAYPGGTSPAEHGRRDGMRRITVEMVLEKVALAVERYVR
jgi:heptosyltransferase I